MLTKIIFRISGMHCTSCAFSIDGELEDTHGVQSASTSYAKQVTEVEFDPQQLSVADIIVLIKQVGYAAEPMQSS